MADIPPPPRMSGDEKADFPAFAQWLHDFWTRIVLGQVYVETAAQFESETFDPGSLPDPASATIASAQNTANNAYVLAASASSAASAAQTTANAASTKLGPVGQVTIANTDTTGALSFSTAQPDTNYFVTASCVAISGAPAAGAHTVKSMAKLAGSVTLTLVAAPGAGTSVTFDVMVRRA